MTRATVLVVDDDPQILDLYRTFLAESFEVRTAMFSDEAMARLDDAVDVILLDRRMPDFSGDEVLQTIRDEGYDCRVAMVTAVEPDFDLVDLGFDDYVVKPVTKEELIEVVELLQSRSAYDDPVREWLSLLSKRATLRREKGPQALEESAEFARLQREIDDLQYRADEIFETESQDDLESLFRDIDVDSIFEDDVASIFENDRA